MPDTKPKVRISKAHREDMVKLAQQLDEAAKRHDLCSAFRDEIANINMGLVVPLELPKDKRNMRVNIIVTLEGDYEINGTYSDNLAEAEAALIVAGITDALKDIEGVHSVEYEDSYPF